MSFHPNQYKDSCLAKLHSAKEVFFSVAMCDLYWHLEAHHLWHLDQIEAHMQVAPDNTWKDTIKNGKQTLLV